MDVSFDCNMRFTFKHGGIGINCVANIYPNGFKKVHHSLFYEWSEIENSFYPRVALTKAKNPQLSDEQILNYYQYCEQFLDDLKKNFSEWLEQTNLAFYWRVENVT